MKSHDRFPQGFLDTNDGMKTPGIIGLVFLLVIDP